RPNQQHSIARGGFGPRPRSFVNGIPRPMGNVNQSPAVSRRSSAFIEKAPDVEGSAVNVQTVEVQVEVASAGNTMEGMEEGKKPVVKLPPSTLEDHPKPEHSQQQTVVESGDKPAVTVKLPPASSYPTPPSQPIQAVRPTSTIPMHQPRPQKAVSMADIENPASLPPDYPHAGPDSLTQTRNSSAQATEAPPPLPES